MAFLSDIQLRPLATGGIPGCETLGLALGLGQSPLEVVVLRSDTQPSVTAMRTAWKDRHGGRPAPKAFDDALGTSPKDGNRC